MKKSKLAAEAAAAATKKAKDDSKEAGNEEEAKPEVKSEAAKPEVEDDKGPEDSSVKMEVVDENPASSEASSPTGNTGNSKEPELPSLSTELSLNILWDTLSSCLKDLADTPDHHAVLVLQATVEAFFLVHAAPTQPEDKKKVQQKETRQEQLAHIQEQTPRLGETGENNAANEASVPGGAVGGMSPAQSGSTSSNLPGDTQKFLAFAETHRTVLNQILRQSTQHLADGPFSVLVDHTRVLDFDIKRR